MRCCRNHVSVTSSIQLRIVEIEDVRDDPALSLCSTLPRPPMASGPALEYCQPLHRSF